MLVQWTPFSHLSRLQSQFDQAFDAARGQVHEAYRPAVDVFEDAEKISITADLPGVTQEQVELQVDKNVLTFKGERKLARSADDNGRYERSTGAFERSFRIPPTVDVEKISAAMKDGVLTLSLPKKPQPQPRQIKINS